MGRHAVVVGAGAIGVACGHFLSRSGWEVTLIDRGEVGGGCSRANSSLIVPSHARPLPGPGVTAEGLRHLTRRDGPFYIRPRPDPGLLRWLWEFRRASTGEAAKRGFAAMADLGRASLETFEELVRTGEASYAFERRGLLLAYLSARWQARADLEAADLAAVGFRVGLLPRDDLLEVEPAVGPGVRGGLLIEDQAHGECIAYVRSLAGGLESRGVRFLLGREVRRISTRGRTATGVMLDGQAIPADLVVVAAGAWTPALVSPLGIRVPVQPAKGCSCTIDRFQDSPVVPILSDELRVAITPLGDRIRFGGTLELAGFDPRLHRARYEAVVSGARRLLGAAFERRGEQAWYGYRPLTSDGLPVIGWAPRVEGLIIATGHGTLGYTLSPITGKVVAELADGKEPSVPLDLFRADRF